VHDLAGVPAAGGVPKRSRVDAAGIERRIIGWDYVHIAIDDATRMAYAEVLGDEKAATAVAFLARARAFRTPGVRRPEWTNEHCLLRARCHLADPRWRVLPPRLGYRVASRSRHAARGGAG